MKKFFQWLRDVTRTATLDFSDLPAMPMAAAGVHGTAPSKPPAHRVVKATAKRTTKKKAR